VKGDVADDEITDGERSVNDDGPVVDDMHWYLDACCVALELTEGLGQPPRGVLNR
jgi:hypothetical protein